MLLERKQLTSGTTWHAAGLIGQLRGSQNMTRLAKYSADLYVKLEAETGVATGMRQVGSISVALTEERKHEIYRQATVARAFDVDVREISPREVKEMYPHLNTDGVVGAVHLPLDGQCDPANIAMALAKGARQRGAKILEGVKVTAVHQKDGRVTGVSWAQGEERGTIETDVVINCAGMWARDLGAMSGVNIPLHACEHFYLITEPIPGLTRLPVLRVPDECAYYKEDAGKMMLGAFEPVAKPWGMDGIREDFCFDQLPEDMEHFEPILEMGVNRMPMLATAGIHTFFNGPESFTPDDRYYLGEAPGVVEPRRAGMASGINSTFRQIGIATGIAGWGAIFQHIVADEFLRRATAEGVRLTPPPGGGSVADACRSACSRARATARWRRLGEVAYVTGLDRILVLAAILAFVGAALCLVLVRQRDFVAHGAPAGAEPAAA